MYYAYYYVVYGTLSHLQTMRDVLSSAEEPFSWFHSLWTLFSARSMTKPKHKQTPMSDRTITQTSSCFTKQLGTVPPSFLIFTPRSLKKNQGNVLLETTWLPRFGSKHSFSILCWLSLVMNRERERENGKFVARHSCDKEKKQSGKWCTLMRFFAHWKQGQPTN